MEKQAAVRVLLIGATGLVGSALLPRLLDDPKIGHVTVLGRRSTGLSDSRLTERIVSFDALPDEANLYAADWFICAIGTTTAQTKDRDTYRLVDVTWPLTIARRHRAAGGSACMIVTAVRASQRSGNWYLRFKGEAEAGLRALAYPQLHLVRPALIVGARTRGRARERFAVAAVRLISRLLPKLMARYQPLSGEQIAQAMQAIVSMAPAGEHVWEPPDLASLSTVNRQRT